MSKSFIGRLIVSTLGGIIAALTFVVIPVLAAASLGAKSGASILPLETPTVTVTVTPTTAPVTLPPPYLPTDQFIPSLIVLLIFGGVLIAGLLYYIYRIQLRYYSLVRSLNQIGRRVTVVQVGAFPPADHSVQAMNKLTAGDKPGDLKIEGPGTMAVGTPGDFTAKDANNKPVNATWSVTPTEAASVNPNTGAKVSVNPNTAGAFKLNASLDDPVAIGELLVAVSVPETSADELPFVGLGYGALVIAIIIVVAVIVLALTGSLQGEAVATLLGALVGYVFGVSTPTGAKNSQPSGGKTNGGNG